MSLDNWKRVRRRLHTFNTTSSLDLRIKRDSQHLRNTVDTHTSKLLNKTISWNLEPWKPCEPDTFLLDK